MKKTAQNSIIYMAGMVCIAVAGFFSTMILTRILPERTYAQYGLLTTSVTAAVTIIALGMDAAYTRFFYESGYTPAKYLLKSCQIPFALFIIFIAFLLEPKHLILQYVFEEEISNRFAVLIIGYLLFSLFGKFTQLTARMGEFAVNYVLSNLVGKVGFLIVILILSSVIPEVTISWVTFSFLMASLFAVLINLSTLYRIKSVQAGKYRQVKTRQMLSYGIPVMLNNLMMLIIPFAERLIVRDLAGWTVLGIYTAASVFYTVIAIMKSTIDNIWNPIVFQNYENKTFFQQILHDFGLLVTSIMTVGLGACILLRRWLVMILDASYVSAYLIAPAIMFTACCEIYTLIYGVGVNIAKKTQYLVASSVIQLAVSFSLCYLLIPSLGLVGVGIAALMGIVVSRAYRVFLGLRLYSTGQNERKPILLWCIGVAASVFVMFSTLFISDLVVCLSLCIVSLVTINREGIEILKRMGKIFLHTGSLSKE